MNRIYDDDKGLDSQQRTNLSIPPRRLRSIAIIAVLLLLTFGAMSTWAAGFTSTRADTAHASGETLDWIAPVSGPPGTAVTLSGSGFTDPSYSSGVPIQVNIDHGNGNWELLTTVGNAVPDSNGHFLVGFNIPNNAPVGAQLAISALTGSGAGPSVPFTVT